MIEPRPLSAECYIDPLVFAQDARKIFYRSWQCVCHVSEVAAPGEYATYSLIDEEIFVVRDSDGELRAFYNQCRHRGHPLVAGRGRLRNSIVCPYHAWSYTLDGALKNVPFASPEDRRQCEKIRLNEIRLEVVCGFVFVNLDPNTAALGPALADVEKELRTFHPEPQTLRFVAETAIEHDCNWKVSIENYNECYHCPTVHSTSLVKGVLAMQGYSITPRGPTIWHLGKAQSTDEKQYEYDPRHGSRGGDYGSFFIWPNVSLACYPGGYFSVRQWLPINYRKTVYRYRWFSDGEIPDADVVALMDKHRQTTGAEDAVVVAKIQKAMESQVFSPGPYVIGDGFGAASEVGLRHLHELYRRASARS